MTAPAILTFGRPSRRLARVPLLFRARDCEDEGGIFALSYGKRVGLVHTRPGATGVAAVYDRDGRISFAPADRPRLSWEYTSAGTRVRTLLVEPADTNILTRAQDFTHAAWDDNGASHTITANVIRGPDGKMSGHRIVGNVAQAAVWTGNGEKVFGWVLKADTAPTSSMIITELVSPFHARNVLLTWTAGVPSLSTAFGTGRLYPVIPLGDGWYFVAATDDAIVAANYNSLSLIADTVGSGSVYAWLAQSGNSFVPTSPIRSVATALARAADTAYVPFFLGVRALTMYCRHVNLGYHTTGSAVNRRLIHLGGATMTNDPRFQMVSALSNGRAAAFYGDGSVVRNSDTGVVPAMRNLIEQRSQLFETAPAAAAVRAHVALNGGAEVSGALSATNVLHSAFNDTRCYFAGNELLAPAAITDVVISDGALPMDECRELCEVV